MDNRQLLLAPMYSVAKKTAEGENIALVIFPGIGGTGFCASAAVIAVIRVENYLAVSFRQGFCSADLFTQTAVYALIFYPIDFYAAFYAYIVFFGFTNEQLERFFKASFFV